MTHIKTEVNVTNVNIKVLAVATCISSGHRSGEKKLKEINITAIYKN